MKRIIIQQNQSYTLTLPKQWVQRQHLRPGNEITVQEERERLILSGKGIADRTTITLTAPTLPRATKYLLTNAYKKGYDLIEVCYKDAQLLPVIETVVKEMMGHEIIDVKQGKVVIKNVARELEEECPALFRKCFFLCQENMARILEDMRKNTYSHLQDIQDYRNMITRYADYCKRIMIKRQNELLFEFMVLRDLEKVSNELLYLYQYLVTQRIKLKSADQHSMARTFELFKRVMNCYFQGKSEQLEFIFEDNEKFFIGFDQIMGGSKANKRNHKLLYHLANIRRRCQDMVGPTYALLLLHQPVA